RPTGTRTTGWRPARITGTIERSTLSSVWPPCCISSVTASMLCAATISTVSGSGTPDHAVNNVSPPFRRLANVMGSTLQDEYRGLSDLQNTDGANKNRPESGRSEG